MTIYPMKFKKNTSYTYITLLTSFYKITLTKSHFSPECNCIEEISTLQLMVLSLRKCIPRGVITQNILVLLLV